MVLLRRGSSTLLLVLVALGALGAPCKKPAGSAQVVMEIDQPVEAGPQSAEGAVVFRAHAYRKWADGSRTAIPGDELVWRSSIDGAVGVGDAFGARLSPGRHTITLSRSGEEGAGASVEVEVSE